MELGDINKDRKRRKPAIDLSTMVYGKLPPQAVDIEEMVLGSIMVESYCLPTVVNIIFEEVFYTDAHQKVYKAILNLYDKNTAVDLSTVVEQLKVNEDLESVGGPYYVTKLTRDAIGSGNIEAYCMIILQKFMARELIRISGESISDAYEESTDVLDLYDRADNAILNVQERVLKSAIKDMAFYSEKVYDQYQIVKTVGVLGIQTGIVPFDRIFSGLVPPDLFVIAARPGAGKTSLALSLTHHLSIVNNIPGAWFSLEMDGTQLTRRLVSMDSKIPHELIRQGKVHKYEEIKLFNSIDKIRRSCIYIEDKVVVNIRTIRTRANILKRKNKIAYIVVDYLQLMSGVDKKNGNRETEISEISRGLKSLAKELSIPIIALSQLSRKVEERSDKLPQLSDLRESGAIEQDADEVLFLMRPEYYNFTEPVKIGDKEYNVNGLCIGKVAKNRHGKTENFAMHFEGSLMQFSTHSLDYVYSQPTSSITNEAGEDISNIF